MRTAVLIASIAAAIGTHALAEAQPKKDDEAALSGNATSWSLPGDDGLASKKEFNSAAGAEGREILDRAYPDLSAKWPFGKIPVCWEDAPGAIPESDRKTVKRAAEAWAAQSGVQYLYWNSCEEIDNFAGVRIKFEDTGPWVKGIGKYLAYSKQTGAQRPLENNMILNNKFVSWPPTRKISEEEREHFLYVTTLHEFGHALGLTHEQNRPDAPGECAKLKRGSSGNTIDLTPYDPESVMNYCNPTYANGGKLSKWDKFIVKEIYGPKP